MNLKISDQLIRQAAYFAPTYERGKAIFQNHKVKEVHFFKNKQQGSAYEIHALVHGQQDHYKTLIGFSNPYGFHSVNCECPAYNKYHECCKHIIATLFQAQQLLSESDSILWTDGKAYKQQLTATNLLKEYEASLLNEISISPYEDKVKLVPKLKRRGKHFTLEASIGRKRLYVIKDFFTFVEHVQNKTEMNYGKEFTFNHDRAQFEPESLKLLDFLTKLIIDQRTYHQEFKGYMPDKKSLYLTHPQFESFYETFKGSSIPSQFENMDSKTTLLTDELAPIQLSVTQTKNGIVIHHTQSYLNFFQTNTNLFLVTEGQINLCPPAFKRDMFPLLKQIVLSDGPLTMNTELIPGFLSTILPRIQQYVTPESLHQLNEQYDIYPLHSEIYLDVNEAKAVVAKVNYQYGEFSFNPFEEIDIPSVIRDKVKEAHLMSSIQPFHFEQIQDELLLHGDDEIYHFIKEGVPTLMNHHEVHVTDRFKNLNQKPGKKVAVGVRLQSDLMTFKLEDLDFDMSEYKDIMAQYNVKKKFHRLKDGTFLDLDSDYMNSFFNLVEDLELTEADLQEEEIKLSKFRALYLDRILDKNNIKSKQNKAFKQLINDFEQLEEIEYDLPSQLQATLRPYQEVGYRWLKTLSDYQMGGILADDMGLGKTIQIIALLSSDTEKQVHKPSIIVTPSSLIYNWKAELEKFAPHLKCLLITGTAADREEKIKTLHHYDVILTSYDLLRRDIMHYDQTFRYAILDEAHYIKNQNTVSAKTVKQLQSDVRFALTGTPLENSIADVWSIFDFILPGYLLSYAKFKKQYETPITKNQDAKLLERVHQLVAPFIMRRLKKDVLTELPDKIESVVYCELEDEQKKLYEATLVSMNTELQTEMAANDGNQSRIKMFAMLTRLRQLCCHPALYIENYEHESAKLKLCVELIQDSIESGHRILLFSQFTSMFEFIGTELRAQGIPFFVLTGDTKPLERMRLANEFNEGDVPIFLISLKAGGTGLNLTGADVVIHYDPWWNMSAQNQATDRAYRMGQSNKVQVFKLIAKDTIEEKIEKLQQRKLELSESLVKEGETFITNLSPDDISELFSN